MAQRHHAAKELAAAHGGIAKPFFAWRHVGHHAAPCSDDRPLADPDVVREPNLSGQDDAILDNDAAGDAALRDDDAVAADRHIVSDLHQVVDLGPFADHGVADAAAVDGGARTDLYVVLNDDAADLQHLAVTGRSHQVAESILPDGATGMDDHAVADQAVRDRDVGTDGAMAADAHVG